MVTTIPTSRKRLPRRSEEGAELAPFSSRAAKPNLV